MASQKASSKRRLEIARSLEARPQSKPVADPDRPAGSKGDGANEAEQLRSYAQFLQQRIEELETENEDLKARNEALLVANEGLRTKKEPAAETDRGGVHQEIARLNRVLRRSVEELETLLEVLPVGIAVAQDPVCECIKVNPTLAKWLRVSTQMNVSSSGSGAGKLPFRVYRDGRALSPEQMPLQQAIATGEPIHGAELDIVLETGETLHLLAYTAPLFDELGNPRGGVGAFVEIGGRIRTENALREQASMMQAVNDLSLAMTGELELDKLLQTVTEAATELVGAQFGVFYEASREDGSNGSDAGSSAAYTLSGVPWETFRNFPLPRSSPLVKATLREKRLLHVADLEKESEYRSMLESERGGGMLPMRSFLAVPVISRAAKVLGGLFLGHTQAEQFQGEHVRLLCGIAAQAAVAIDNAYLYQGLQQELSERRRAEQALYISEQQFRELADAMPQIVWITNEHGEFSYFNRRWQEYTGLAADNSDTQAWFSVVHPEDLQWGREQFEEACQRQEPFEMEMRLRGQDRHWRWHLSRAIPVTTHGQIRWIGTSTDIHDQKKAEDRIFRLNQTLFSVLESIPDMVFVTNQSREIEFANQAGKQFFEITGYQHRLPPAIEKELEKILRGEENYLPTNFKGVHREQIGKDQRYLLPRIVRMERADASSVFGAVVVLQDVTELRLLDEVKTNLIGTVSHEIKTPVTSIRMALLVLLEQSLGQLNEPQTELLDIARDESERLLRTLNTLLDLTRFEEGKPRMQFQNIDVKDLIACAVRETRGAAQAASIEIGLDLQEPLPEIRLDRERMIHVLTNLITNAIKHSPSGARVHVRGRLEGEDYLYLGVIDQGPGVPEEYREKIFEKFFRVPGNQKGGAGLGLSIVREFIHAHGGQIGVKPAGSGGSEFYVMLPLKEEGCSEEYARHSPGQA